jgi:two-component system, LuxR family, response regulator FixJ
VMKPQPVLTKSAPVIVVVDDDVAVCNSLKFSLELDGFAVRAYRSAAELLNAGDLSSCNCFIIDQNMPVMSGMELIAKLRERKVLAPAILIVSQPNATLSARATAAKVPIVEKPFFGNTLLDRIREACHQGG